MSSVGGQKLFTGDPISTVSNTAVPLHLTPFAIKSLVIQASPGNIGTIAIGDENVNINTGMILGPGDTMTISAEPDSRYNDFFLNEVYAYSNTSGNIIRIMGFKRRT